MKKDSTENAAVARQTLGDFSAELERDAGYALPPKADGSKYTIEEILDYIDPEYAESYRESYRWPLAFTRLQQEVKHKLADECGRAEVTKTTRNEAEYVRDLAMTAPELQRSARKNPKFTHAIKSDPYRMARKHAVDLICEEHRSFVNLSRGEIIEDVQSIILLMADNEINHGAGEKGRDR